MTTLHLMIGLPCSGKTTLAMKLAIELKALRLTPDDWHRHLFGQDATQPEHDERHNKIEELLWKVAASALGLGTDVILDFGMWQRSEREDFRERAAALGATTVIHFLDVPHDELFARLEARNEGSVDKVTHIPLSMLKECIPNFQAPGATELALNGK
jgi:predicted kinase